jgi:hypothetical protein
MHDTNTIMYFLVNSLFFPSYTRRRRLGPTNFPAQKLLTNYPTRTLSIQWCHSSSPRTIPFWLNSSLPWILKSIPYPKFPDPLWVYVFTNNHFFVAHLHHPCWSGNCVLSLKLQIIWIISEVWGQKILGLCREQVHHSLDEKVGPTKQAYSWLCFFLWWWWCYDY